MAKSIFKQPTAKMVKDFIEEKAWAVSEILEAMGDVCSLKAAKYKDVDAEKNADYTLCAFTLYHAWGKIVNKTKTLL